MSTFNIDVPDWQGGAGIGGAVIVSELTTSIPANTQQTFGPYNVVGVPALWFTCTGQVAGDVIYLLGFNDTPGSSTPLWGGYRYLPAVTATITDVVSVVGPYLWVTVDNSDNVAVTVTFQVSAIASPLTTGFGNAGDRNLYYSNAPYTANHTETDLVPVHVPGPAVLSVFTTGVLVVTLSEYAGGVTYFPFIWVPFNTASSNQAQTLTVALPNNSIQVGFTVGAASATVVISLTSAR